MAEERTWEVVLKEMRAQSRPTQEQLYEWNRPIQDLARTIKNDLNGVELKDESKLLEYLNSRMMNGGRFRSLAGIKIGQPTNPIEVTIAEGTIGSPTACYQFWMNASGAGIQVYLLKMQEQPA
jgi:hypothetical protein